MRVVLLSGILAMIALAQASPADDPPARQPSPEAMFGDLIGAIKATPGCLGVETGSTDSGKGVIFAWFENKAAAMKWYYSDAHQDLMKKFFPRGPSGRKPMAGVPDDAGPIMAIASITIVDPSTNRGSPFKQIAIELYQPLPGGLSVGGRFAPDKVKIPSKKSEK